MREINDFVARTKSTVRFHLIEPEFSLKNPFISNKTIADLLEEGYKGVDYKLAKDNAFAAAAHKFKDRIKWTITKAEEREIGLMTADTEALESLLQFMLTKFSWCPTVYSLEEAEEIFIFTPQNELEKAAIEATISGEYGWQGSLYSLELYEYENYEVGFIFATRSPESPEQEWLLVKLNFEENTVAWSYHDGTLEQVYYIWKEKIQLPEPNYNPTTDELLDALKD
jgi:serine/threonine-protein kinase